MLLVTNYREPCPCPFPAIPRTTAGTDPSLSACPRSHELGIWIHLCPTENFSGERHQRKNSEEHTIKGWTTSTITTRRSEICRTSFPRVALQLYVSTSR
jgi:hypothetical protein